MCLLNSSLELIEYYIMKYIFVHIIYVLIVCLHFLTVVPGVFKVADQGSY